MTPKPSLASDSYRILSWTMAASMKDYISQPPLQQDVVRWFSSDQWDVSRRMHSIEDRVTLMVSTPAPFHWLGWGSGTEMASSLRRHDKEKGGTWASDTMRPPSLFWMAVHNCCSREK